MHRLSKLGQRSAALRLRRLVPWALSGLLGAGCLFDPDDRCGPNQVLSGDETVCQCVAGYVAGATGCVSCAENEVPDPVAGCACAEGYVRPAAGAVCTALPPDVHPPSGVGKACMAAADCAGLDASYCEAGFSHSCVVADCTVSPNSCFTGTECCDFTSFGLPRLCIPAGMCPT